MWLSVVFSIYSFLPTLPTTANKFLEISSLDRLISNHIKFATHRKYALSKAAIAWGLPPEVINAEGLKPDYLYNWRSV
jgi:hypothetical protein